MDPYDPGIVEETPEVSFEDRSISHPRSRDVVTVPLEEVAYPEQFPSRIDRQSQEDGALAVMDSDLEDITDDPFLFLDLIKEGEEVGGTLIEPAFDRSGPIDCLER